MSEENVAAAMDRIEQTLLNEAKRELPSRKGGDGIARVGMLGTCSPGPVVNTVWRASAFISLDTTTLDKLQFKSVTTWLQWKAVLLGAHSSRWFVAFILIGIGAWAINFSMQISVPFHRHD